MASSQEAPHDSAVEVKRRDLRVSAAACERAFSFLTIELDFRHRSTELRDSGFRVDYVGPVLGVRLDWYRCDPFFVWLVRLADGDFPSMEPIRPDSQLDYVDLESLEDIAGYERQVYTGDFCPMPDDATAQLVADSLRLNGSSLLRGDLRQWEAVEQRIKQRFCDNIMKHGGPGALRQLGWS